MKTIIFIFFIFFISCSCIQNIPDYSFNINDLPEPNYPDLKQWDKYNEMDLYIQERINSYLNYTWGDATRDAFIKENYYLFAINDFLWTHYKYKSDNEQFGEDKWQTPLQFLSGVYDDCDGFTLTFMYLVYWYTGNELSMSIMQDPNINPKILHCESFYNGFIFFDIESYNKCICNYTLKQALSIAQFLDNDQKIRKN